MNNRVSDIRGRIRGEFPALASETVYLENAGGSQVPRQVIERITRYLSESYVQLGAGYPLSQYCTKVVDDAHWFISRFMNAGEGEVILGSSTTALLNMLADCYSKILEPGSEIIIAESGHEANMGPWKRLAESGIVIRWWRVDPEKFVCPINELETLLSEKTALVALPHVSNLLGDIVDIEAVTKLAHRYNARVVVDGVAYAPHRAIDCEAWDVDWYAYSSYKVYGPHMAALYGRKDAVSELTGPNHFFIPRDDIPYKFEPGGVSHEGCAGLLGLGDYLRVLLGLPETAELGRGEIAEAFSVMAALEQPLQERLIEYLSANPAVRIIGPLAADSSRVGTISFVHDSLSSSEITAVVDKSGIAIRHGHMYAYDLCQALGMDSDEGVVRVSFVHYNTLDEVERLIGVLDGIAGFRRR